VATVRATRKQALSIPSRHSKFSQAVIRDRQLDASQEVLHMAKMDRNAAQRLYIGSSLSQGSLSLVRNWAERKRQQRKRDRAYR